MAPPRDEEEEDDEEVVAVDRSVLACFRCFTSLRGNCEESNECLKEIITTHKPDRYLHSASTPALSCSPDIPSLSLSPLSVSLSV